LSQAIKFLPLFLKGQFPFYVVFMTAVFITFIVGNLIAIPFRYLFSKSSARFLPFTFHFWTRGIPETVSFGKQHSREVHGANMVVLYYQKGLRSAWAQVEKGQYVNRDPKDQTNPFPTMIIGIRGKAVAKIGGKEITLQAGQMAFIPAGVSHEAWNPYDEPAEIILLMFGEGA
jgi:mannose-6-phosphate isomerase-like protein (cupin superfamily)